MVFCGSLDNVIDRGVLLRTSHHDVFLFVDALPVHEEDFAWLDITIVSKVKFIVNDRSQTLRLSETVLHTLIALNMKCVRGNPYKCHTVILAVAVCYRLMKTTHRFCHHNRFTCTCWCLEYYLPAHSVYIQLLDGLINEFLYLGFLISFKFHSASSLSFCLESSANDFSSRELIAFIDY